MAEANWYVVHTYSGYENKVKANIEKTIENRHLEDQILEVRVPMQDVVEMKKLVIQIENVSIDFAEGDTIAVVAGVWKDTVGVVQRIDFNKQVVTINVELFGRETPVEIGFAEVRRV